MRYRTIVLRSFHNQRGLSLVELMIAITLGLILTAGILQIFSNSKQTYRIEEALSRVQESGRMALNFISNDVRMVGFWGCQRDPSKILNDLAAGAGYFNFTATGIGGTEGGAGAPDTLTLHGADSTPDLALQATSTAGNPFQVGLPNDLKSGDLVLVSDCTGGNIFQVTGTNPSTSGTVNHSLGAGTPGNATQIARDYGDDASIYYVHEITYSLQAGSDGQLALWRSIDGTNQEIVDDVSDMQIQYGEDIDGDESVDRYVDANNVSNFNNVYSVRVQLTVQTAAANTSLTAGKRITRNFSSTIAIRNRVL